MNIKLPIKDCQISICVNDDGVNLIFDTMKEDKRKSTVLINMSCFINNLKPGSMNRKTMSKWYDQVLAKAKEKNSENY